MCLACILSIWAETKWTWFRNKVLNFPFKKRLLKMSAAKFQLFCFGLNVSSMHSQYLSRDKMDVISQTTFSNAFSSMKIVIKFSLKFVPKGPIYNIPALVQIMAWRHPGAKPLSEPMVVSLPTHICVTRPQWVNMSDYLACHACFLQNARQYATNFT